MSILAGFASGPLGILGAVRTIRDISINPRDYGLPGPQANFFGEGGVDSTVGGVTQAGFFGEGGVDRDGRGGDPDVGEGFGGDPEGAPFAHGGSFIAHRPQLISVGERGAEEVSISPLAGRPPRSGGQVVLMFSGINVFDGIAAEQAARTINRALLREQGRIV